MFYCELTNNTFSFCILLCKIFTSIFHDMCPRNELFSPSASIRANNFDNDGRTPLHLACSGEKTPLDMIKAL